QAPGGARGHQVDDRLAVVLGQRPDRDHMAQAQYRYPVGDGLDVVQVVRDDEDRDALVPEPADEVEHDPGLGDAQGGRGLVQDDQLGLAQHGPGHRDGLALAAGQRPDRLPDRPDRHHGQVGQRALGLLLHRGLVQHPVPDRLPAQEHVLHDIQVVGQRQVLIHGGDAEGSGVLRGVQLDRLALPEDLALVLRPDARDRLDQRALARAVVADQRRYLPDRDVQVDVHQNAHRTEVLAYADKAQQRLVAVGRRGGGRPGERRLGLVGRYLRLDGGSFGLGRGGLRLDGGGFGRIRRDPWTGLAWVRSRRPARGGGPGVVRARGGHRARLLTLAKLPVIRISRRPCRGPRTDRRRAARPSRTGPRPRSSSCSAWSPTWA